MQTDFNLSVLLHNDRLHCINNKSNFDIYKFILNLFSSPKSKSIVAIISVAKFPNFT